MSDKPRGLFVTDSVLNGSMQGSSFHGDLDSVGNTRHLNEAVTTHFQLKPLETFPATLSKDLKGILMNSADFPQNF